MMCVVLDASGRELGKKQVKLAQAVAELEYERAASEAKTQKIIKLEREIAYLKQQIKSLRRAALAGRS